MGSEDIDVIVLVIYELLSLGIDVIGLYLVDILFYL